MFLAPDILQVDTPVHALAHSCLITSLLHDKISLCYYFFRFNDEIKHFMVVRYNGQYSIELSNVFFGSFDSIMELVLHFSEYPLPTHFCVTLKSPRFSMLSCSVKECT